MLKNAALLLMTFILIAGCTVSSPKHGIVYDHIGSELDQAIQSNMSSAQPQAVNDALLPPLNADALQRGSKPLEQRFDLVVNNAPANQVFMGIVSGTHYSMLVHPEVTGTISVNLKDVTVLEALEAIHDIYGYDYKLSGSRIQVLPLTMQTRVFQVNYISGQRKGTSDIQVTSGSISSAGSSGTSTTTTPTAGGAGSTKSSSISTISSSDFWVELAAALSSIVGTTGGRNVVINPQSGVVVVRAMPSELRGVQDFLRATQLSLERQVILEAKILEVQLDDSYQAGINWAAFKTTGNSRTSLGQLTPGAALAPNGALASSLPITGIPGTSIGNSSATGTLFGLTFQTGSFAALISFLETQGNVQVLSSPRIATINNQKAVLKVGSDEFFVTNVSSVTTASASTSTTTPTVTLTPFFSGIALDVTPQIDPDNNIILHIHPSVSQVSTANKEINLGTSGILNLPLATSSISETDSIVRAQDGQIVAIGGLMRQSMNETRSQVPGLGDVPWIGSAFRNTTQSAVKRELVILLKPTVVQSGSNWAQDLMDSRNRFNTMDRGFSYGGKTEIFGTGAERQ